MNLIRGDGEGMWDLHLDSVQKAVKLFEAMDATNYKRWRETYLEDMRRLSVTAPEVHGAFMMGQFEVKRAIGEFNAVGLDLALEQSIQRSKKSTWGVIGKTQEAKFVAEWETIYHEMLGVINLYRKVSGIRMQNHDLGLHHEFIASETKACQERVQKMITFITRHENPFHINQQVLVPELHHILTQEKATNQIRNQILKAPTIGHDRYIKRRRERFVTKK